MALRGKTSIGRDCWIGEYVVVGAGAVIGNAVTLDSFVSIEVNARVGDGTLLTYRAYVGTNASIGPSCEIGGFVCERSIVGADCRVMGDLVHRQLDPYLPWDAPEVEEVSPVLADRVFVGWGATVVGPVVLEEKSYVCAGAVVTRSVPSKHIAYGNDNIVPHTEWNGALGRSLFFS